jgi:hypothetical protein
MEVFTVLKRSPAVILAAAFLASCGTKGLAPSDASADRADGPRVDAPHADAPHDVAIEVVPTDAGSDVAPLPPPVVLTLAPGCGAARLALGGGELYWTERATGLVKKVSVTTSQEVPTLVASQQPSPGPITADDEGVYWSNEGDRTIRREPLPTAGSGAPDGGAPLWLKTAEPVNALLARRGQLFFSAGASTYQVAHLPIVIRLLASFAACRPSTAGALAASDAYLYQTADLLQFIVRERLDGSQLGRDPCAAADAGAPQIQIPETVTHTQGSLVVDALQVTGGQVVWADHGFIAARPVDDLAAGSNRDVALSAGSNTITGFVVVGDRVFLGESDDPGAGPTAHTVQVASFVASAAGGETPSGTVVATNQPGARSFVTDDSTHVYWATHTPSATPGAPADCAIVSLATK